MHYERWRAHGDLFRDVKPGLPARPLDVRFWEKVDKHGPIPAHVPHLGECWIWNGKRDRRGYGRMSIGKFKQVTAPRVAWELEHGEAPGGLFVLHACDNPPCVRASHLFLGTHDDNMADMIAKGRHWRPSLTMTHCRRGHEYTPENLVPDKGSRLCRTCRNELRRARRARARLARSA